MDSLYNQDVADNPEGAAKLAKWLGTPDAAAPEAGPGTRLAYATFTAVPKAVEGLSTSAGNLAELLGAKANSGPNGNAWLDSSGLPPAATTAQKGADLIGGLLPMALQMYATGGVANAATGLTGLATRAPLLARTIASATEFGQIGLSQDASTGLEQAGEGGALAQITGRLARSDPRRWLLSAGLGLASKTFFDRNQPEGSSGVSPGDISGSAMFLTSALLGKPFKTSHLPGEIPVKTGDIYDAFANGREGLAADPVRKTAIDPSETLLQGFGAPPIISHEVVPPRTVEEAIAQGKNVRPASADADIYQAFGAPPISARPPVPTIEEAFANSREGLVNSPTAAITDINSMFAQESPIIANQNRGVIMPEYTGELQRLQNESGLASAPSSPQGMPVLSPSFEVLPPEIQAIKGNELVPTGTSMASWLFNPENAQRIAAETHSAAAASELGTSNLQQIQTALFTRDVRQQGSKSLLDWAKFVAGLEDAAPKSVTDLEAEQAFRAVVQEGSRGVENNPLLGKSGQVMSDAKPTPKLEPVPGEGTTTGMARGKMRSRPSWQTSEGGFTAPELTQAMGRASFGALVGGVGGGLMDDPGSHDKFVSGMIGGALVGIFGPTILRSAISGELAKAKPRAASPLLQKIESTTVGAPKRTFTTLLSEAQARINANESTTFDRVLGRFDDYMGSTVGPIFSRLMGQSAGPINGLVGDIDRAFRKVSLIQADETMKALTTKYLEGAISKDEYFRQMGTDSNRKAYADFATVARDSVDGLQEIVTRGLGDNARAQMVLDSQGKYLTRSYRLFVDKFTPSPESTSKLANKLFEDKTWGDMSVSQISDGLNQWVREVQQSKFLYRPSDSKTIDQQVFKQRQVLNTEWKQFLGEITDPVDRVRLTTLKLKPMAEASNFMHSVASGLTKSDEGLPFMFSTHGEVEAAQQAALKAYESSPSDLLRRQIAELQSYQYVAPDARYGSLQGRYVHRHINDVLNDWDHSGAADGAMSRAIVGLNQMMKSNVTYRNPMSIVRQVVSTPFFLQVGRGWSKAGEAMQVLRDPNSPMYKELVNNGIIGVDQITKDVLRDVDQLSGGLATVASADGAKAFLGRIESLGASAVAHGKFIDGKLADWFKFPDQVVRASTYMAAKVRYAEELGKALDHPDVINKSVEWADRYTMNYNMIPKAVGALRNVPFANMFISYAAEMGRILKNLGEDVVKGDSASRMNAVMALGFMVALPETLQKTSEASLNDKDRADWDKVKAGMPVYAKDRFMFVQGRDKATGKFRVIDFSNVLPADQFQQAIRALVDGRVGDAAANNPVVGWDNNPALNIASSFMAGEDRFTNRKLRGPVDSLAMVAKEVGGPLVPGGSQWRNAELAFREGEGGVPLTDKRGKSMTAGDFWLPWATALKSSNVDLNTIQQGAVSDYKSNVANEMAYFNDINRANYPREVKEKAASRTKEALRQLQLKLSTQLGIDPPVVGS